MPTASGCTGVQTGSQRRSLRLLVLSSVGKASPIGQAFSPSAHRATATTSSTIAIPAAS